jgi:hypothetical protein
MNYPAAKLRGIRCHAGLVADCKKLSIYSQQHPSTQGEGTIGNPTESGWRIKKITDLELKLIKY